MRLEDPEVLKPFLRRHGLRAEKGLGQHFLCSAGVVEAIVRETDGFSSALEIGPGPGVLTGPISRTVDRMVALEVDDRMIAALPESAPAADVRKLDALVAPLAEIFAELPGPRVLVSNLPYYITGPLLNRFDEVRDSFDKAVLMMQREVAVRIQAGPGKRERGSLSVFLQAHFAIRTLVQAPAGAFLPPPKVDSTVLVLTPKVSAIAPEHEEGFFRFVRMAFAQPRKTMINNLVAALAISRDEIADRVDAMGFRETLRPSDLSEADLYRLYQAFLPEK